MTCSAASTLKPQAGIPLLPANPPTTPQAWQAVRIVLQNALAQIRGAAGVTGVNVIPQQYALLAGSALPPIASTSNCTVTADTGTPLFGAGGSYKIAITGSPATVTLAVDTAWPLHPGSAWIASFFQQASAAIAGVLTITTPTKSYTTDFTTTLSVSGFQRLYDTLNLIADTATSFGLSFTFTGGTGQSVWLDGLMLEPYFGVAMQPSPFISTSSPLTLDNNPDGTYVKLLGSHASGNVAYNYKGVWSALTSYVIGDEVVYGQSYWLCTTANTGSAPPSSNWQVVGSYAAFLGAWSSLTTYAIGAEVTYNGNFWIAVIQNSNSAPTTSNSNWQIAGPTSLDNISDGTTYQRTQRYNFGNNTSASGWVFIGQITLTAASSMELVWSSGQGYNSNSNQQASCRIMIRAGNGTAAPNLSGISVITHGASSPILQLKANAYADSVSPSNTVWQLYAQLAAYTLGPLTVTVNAAAGDSFTFDGTGGQADPGPASTVTVVAYIGQYLNPINGSGLDGLYDGNTYGRPLLARLNAGRPWIDFSENIHANKNTDNVADGATYIRMPAPPAVSAAATTSLSQSGTTTTINVGASTFYLGNILLSASSGSVNPGAYGKYYVYFDASTYASGAQTYQATTDATVITQNPFRFYVGTITTASGGGGSGGGGGFGGGGCCLHESQMIELADGWEIPARELTPDMILLSHEGPVAITELRFLPHREWYKVRLDNGVELFVAGDHRFLDDDFNQLRTWDLKLGQRVRARNGYAIVTGLHVLWTEATKVAIEVAEPHTYYVQGILSHNKALC